MDKLNDVLKSAVANGNVMEKIEGATGTYDDKVADNKDTEGKTAYGSLPKGTDPNPFTIGQIGSK
jgi:hypothetical protein